MTRKLWVMGIVVCFCEFQVIGADGEKNLIANGDFEKSDLGEGIPEGWKKGAYSTDSIFVVAETCPDSFGKKCIRIGGQGSKPLNRAIHSELISVDPKIPLRITAWIKSSGAVEGGGEIYFAIAWYDQDQSLIVLNDNPKTPQHVYLNHRAKAKDSEDWKKINPILNPMDENYRETMGMWFIPKNAAFVELRFFTVNYFKEVWLDDVIAVQGME